MEDKIELKEKKPRTEKQIKSFQNAQQKRVESLKIKRDKIKEIKGLSPDELLTDFPKYDDLPKEDLRKEDLPVKTPKKSNVIVPFNESTDEEPEIIYIKKNKKKPKKKIIIEDSSSSDEDVVRLRKPKKIIPDIILPEKKEVVYRFI
jgi:hypothetical protein